MSFHVCTLFISCLPPSLWGQTRLVKRAAFKIFQITVKFFCSNPPIPSPDQHCLIYFYSHSELGCFVSVQEGTSRQLKHSDADWDVDQWFKKVSSLTLDILLFYFEKDLVLKSTSPSSAWSLRIHANYNLIDAQSKFVRSQELQ